MNKLFDFREWLTIPQAVEHLNGIFKNKINEADVLKLGLDKHLTLSLVFHNFINVRKGFFVPTSTTEEVDVKKFLEEAKNPEEIFQFLHETNVWREFSNDIEEVVFQEDVEIFRGCLDLTMIGSESVYVENQYFKLILGENNLSSDRSEGSITLIDDKREIIYILLSEQTPSGGDRYKQLIYPPKDSFLAVRTEVLRDFEQSLLENSKEEKTLAPKTRNDYLRTIQALAQLATKGLIGEPYTDAANIVTALRVGKVDCPVSEKTLANYLIEVGDVPKKR